MMASDSHCAIEPEAGHNPEQDLEGLKPRLGRNTWPRKKVRQYTHVVSVFDEDLDTQGQPVTTSGSNTYFVSADDSVTPACGSRGMDSHSFDAGSIQRIPRNSRLPLPPG